MTSLMLLGPLGTHVNSPELFWHQCHLIKLGEKHGHETPNDIFGLSLSSPGDASSSVHSAQSLVYYSPYFTASCSSLRSIPLSARRSRPWRWEIRVISLVLNGEVEPEGSFIIMLRNLLIKRSMVHKYQEFPVRNAGRYWAIRAAASCLGFQLGLCVGLGIGRVYTASASTEVCWKIKKVIVDSSCRAWNSRKKKCRSKRVSKRQPFLGSVLQTPGVGNTACWPI
jgi:hypothetical protein